MAAMWSSFLQASPDFIQYLTYNYAFDNLMAKPLTYVSLKSVSGIQLHLVWYNVHFK